MLDNEEREDLTLDQINRRFHRDRQRDIRAMGGVKAQRISKRFSRVFQGEPTQDACSMMNNPYAMKEGLLTLLMRSQ